MTADQKGVAFGRSGLFGGRGTIGQMLITTRSAYALRTMWIAGESSRVRIWMGILFAKYTTKYAIHDENSYRKSHTKKKIQPTSTRKSMYNTQRPPCRAAMLFIRRNVPANIPPVSANASFCPRTAVSVPTHEKRNKKIGPTIWDSWTADSFTSFPIPIDICTLFRGELRSSSLQCRHVHP